MDLAVGSAVAAEAIGSALDAKDTSKAALAGYRQRLIASHVGQDMKTYAKAPSFLEAERMCKQYGTCLAIAAPGALKWHYPRGGFGVQFREG
jgi:electron transfer flavoprotein-quinone oxidoreductase